MAVIVWLCAIGDGHHSWSQVIVEQATAATTQTSGDDSADQTPPATGFSVQKEDPKITNALEDFDRYRDKKAWEVAFHTLAGIADQDCKGMVPAGEAGRDGLLISTRQRLWKALVSLSPEGKQAYRLFNDPRARQLLQQAKRDLDEGRDDTASLQKIFDDYFITSVGAEAADHLADSAFESGRFARAAGIWESVLRDETDADVPRLRLHTKRAIALARAGLWTQFHQALQQVRDESSSRTVTLGGRQIAPAEYLASLEPHRSADTQPAAIPDSSEPLSFRSQPIDPPARDTPAWQMTFLGEDVADKISSTLTNMGWGAMAGAINTSVVPPCVCDSSRVYVNWVGVCFALDIKTGKLLWRTRKFTDVSDHLNELLQWSVDPRGFTLQLAGDRLLAVELNPAGAANQGNDASSFCRFACLNAQSGHEIWSASGATELANWDFMGAPLVVGDTFYAVASSHGTQQIHLLAVTLENGKRLWEAALGTSQAGRNFRGVPINLSPVLLAREGAIDVLTNNGALLEVSTSTRRLEWAFTYDGPPVVNGEGQFFMFNGTGADQLVMPGALLLSGGTLYVKESRANSLLALDLSAASGPALQWRRPVSESEALVCLDDKDLYLLGTELSAVDRQSRAMKWSTKLPPGRPIRTIVAGRSLFAFFGRGVYQVDLVSGDVIHIFRGSDRDSLGGALYTDGQRLICVSNLAVTAYPVAAPAH